MSVVPCRLTLAAALAVLREAVPQGLIQYRILVNDHGGSWNVTHSLSAGSYDSVGTSLESCLKGLAEQLRSPAPRALALDHIDALLREVTHGKP
jgi:hypothetical protein